MFAMQIFLHNLTVDAMNWPKNIGKDIVDNINVIIPGYKNRLKRYN